MRPLSFFILFLFLFLSIESAQAQVVDEDKQSSEDLYLWLPNQFLPQLGSIGIGNRFAQKSGTVSGLSCALTNAHTRGELYEIDYESTYCLIRHEQDFWGFHWLLDLPMVYLSSGTFDGAIRSFHDTFGFSNGPRRSDNDDSFSSIVFRENFNVRNNTTYILQPTLSVGKNVSDNVFLSGSVLIPIFNSDLSPRLPELKLSFLYNELADQIFSYGASVEGLLIGDTRVAGLKRERYQVGTFSFLKIRLFESLRAVVAQSISSRLEKDIPGFSSYDWYVDLGGELDFGSSGTVNLSLRENLSPGSSSADVSLLLSYSLVTF